MWQAHHLAVCLVRLQNARAHTTDIFSEAHHKVLSNRVDGRICYLCKLLTKIVEENLWFVAQHSQRSVVTH